MSGRTGLALEQDDFYFEPTVLVGKPGQELTLRLFNEGEALHNFSLREQGIDQDVKAGEKGVEVKVKIPESGGLVFSCKYHSAQDMRGELRAQAP